MKYTKEAGILWRTYVAPSGQADTVQGELIRAIEKLRDEAQRNGNINWRRDHEIMVEFVRDTLLRSGLFEESADAEIRSDIEKLMDAEHPITSDEPYDRLTDRIVEWSQSHPDPVSHPHDPELHI